MGGDDYHGLGITFLLALFLPLGLPGVIATCIGAVLNSMFLMKIGLYIICAYGAISWTLEIGFFIYSEVHRHRDRKEHSNLTDETHQD